MRSMRSVSARLSATIVSTAVVPTANTHTCAWADRWITVLAGVGPPSCTSREASASVDADMAATADGSNTSFSGRRDAIRKPSVVAINAPITPGTPSTTWSINSRIDASITRSEH